MAILKILSHGKSREAKKRVLQYVMNPEKTREDLCVVSGDYQGNDMHWKTVFQEFERVRTLFDKADKQGRTYTHGTVSFAPGEISPEGVSAFASELVERIYPGHQVLTAVHIDTDYPHAHFVVETVSYLDGSMLHGSKQDLAQAKKVCNEMCKERNLSVARKGHHADGSAFEESEVTTWNKDKWHQMQRDPKKSYLVDLALAVQDCTAAVSSRADFCCMMEQEYGWQVIWKDTKKNITFTDSEGHRVRDTNLNKTFQMNVTKEELNHAFARNDGRAAYDPKVAGRKPAIENPTQPPENREPVAERPAGKGRKSSR